MKKRKEKKREKNKKKCMQLHPVQGICALLLAAVKIFNWLGELICSSGMVVSKTLEITSYQIETVKCWC